MTEESFFTCKFYGERKSIEETEIARGVISIIT